MKKNQQKFQGEIYFGDNLPILKKLPSESVSLIYIDPPFNTGKTQSRRQLQTNRVVAGEQGDRIGYKGQEYKTTFLGEKSYQDKFADFKKFIYPRLIEAKRILKSNGSLYFHIDYREVHYCKVWLDEIFGRDNFLNEIIWAYDYGARSTKKWPAKHDNILWYCKNPKKYIFNYEEVDRIAYMSPGLVGAEKVARGKIPTDTWWAHELLKPTDTWWHTIVSPNSKEKTGYPTQKPIKLLERVIIASSNVGDTVMDFFAGSGTFGEAAIKHSRNFILIDCNQPAIEVMKKRFKNMPEIIFYD